MSARAALNARNPSLPHSPTSIQRKFIAMETQFNEDTDPAQDDVITLGARNCLWFADEKSVEFKPWNGREELALSKAIHNGRSKLEGGRVGRKITLTLQQMCTKLAGKTFWELDAKGNYVEACTQVERENHIRSMWETDVLVAYLLLRIDALDDPLVSLDLPSPYSTDGKRDCNWKGDITALPFEGSDDIDTARWEYTLRRPMKMRGKDVTKLVIGPLRWGTADGLKFQTHPYEAKMRGIAGSIHSAPEVTSAPGVVFTMEDLQGMRKSDIEALVREIDRRHNGLNLEIEVYDTVAEESFDTSLPWVHPDFFGSSSQSGD